jgi:hypothetical protein
MRRWAGGRWRTTTIFGSLVSSGLFVFGSVDEVRRELLEQWRVFPAEYITLTNHYAQTPKEVVNETLDTFQRHVKPALDEVIYCHTAGGGVTGRISPRAGSAASRTRSDGARMHRGYIN